MCAAWLRTKTYIVDYSYRLALFRTCAIATMGAAMCLPHVKGQAPSPPKDEIAFSTPSQTRIFRIRAGVFTTRELQDKYPVTEQLVLPRLQEFRTMEVSSAEFGIHLHGGPEADRLRFCLPKLHD